MGWNVSILQAALDHPVCGARAGSGKIEDCPLFNIQPDYSLFAVSRLGLESLRLPRAMMGEDCERPNSALCGSNPPRLSIIPTPTSTSALAGDECELV